jgi:hypothetical protein
LCLNTCVCLCVCTCLYLVMYIFEHILFCLLRDMREREKVWVCMCVWGRNACMSFFFFCFCDLGFFLIETIYFKFHVSNFYFKFQTRFGRSMCNSPIFVCFCPFFGNILFPFLLFFFSFFNLSLLAAFFSCALLLLVPMLYY